MATSPSSPDPKTSSTAGGLLGRVRSSFRLNLIVAVIGLLIFAVVVVGVMARNALPGSWLYVLKTGVFEPAGSLTALTDDSKAAHQISLIENRLSELNLIVRDNATSSAEALSNAVSLNATQVDEVLGVLKDGNFTSEERLDILGRLAAITRAEEILAKSHPELTDVKNTIANTRDTVSGQLKTEIEQFTQNTEQQRVMTYIGALLTAIGTGLPQVAEGSDAQKQTILRVRDAQESIIEHDYRTAIDALIRAQSALKTDAYLYGGERGEGPQPAPPTTTEGQ